MDFIRYAEAAAALLNADLSEVDGLAAYLDDRPGLQERAARPRLHAAAQAAARAAAGLRGR